MQNYYQYYLLIDHEGKTRQTIRCFNQDNAVKRAYIQLRKEALIHLANKYLEDNDLKYSKTDKAVNTAIDKIIKDFDSNKLSFYLIGLNFKGDSKELKFTHNASSLGIKTSHNFVKQNIKPKNMVKTGINRRTFSIQRKFIDGYCWKIKYVGRYKGITSLQAAKKAFRTILKKENREEYLDRNRQYFIIKEITAGSQKKSYRFTGQVVDIPNPKKRIIGGKEIVYNKKYIVKSL